MKNEISIKTKTVKEKKVLQPVIEMLSYSIKMVIPTGAYANIQPEIIVKAGTPEQAHEFIAPHLNKLWKEYFMINERRNEPAPVKVVTPDVSGTYPKIPVKETPSPVASVAFEKATQAITACLSNEALEMIILQVQKSVKLSSEDKTKLLKLAEERGSELKLKVTVNGK